MNTLDERGLTLTELALVGAMGFLVMSAIMAFYMNCQSVWTDASSKSIAQREATGLSEHIAEQVHRSAKALVTEVVLGDPMHCRIELFDQLDPNNAWYTFWWEPTDSLIHERAGTAPATTNVTAVVERFRFEGSNELVEMKDLRLRSAEGWRVSLSTSMALYNR